MQQFTCVLFTTALLGVAARLPAATFFGPTPYLSAADSPFDLSGLGSTFWLEDFEDGELNTPGVQTLSLTFVRQPGPRTDSVDGDDGSLDGKGTSGYSLFSDEALIELTDPPRFYMGMTFLFSHVNGQLPTAAGVVVTDCAPNSSVHLQLLDEQLRVVDQFYTQPFFAGGLGDDQDTGETLEDRFVGVVDLGGISAFRVTLLSRSDPFGGVEMDHLQYGRFVPEPDSFTGFAIGCVALTVGVVLNRTVNNPRRRGNVLEKTSH